MTRPNRIRRGTDPRRAGGTVAGPGGPRDRNAVVIDATDAVLLDGLTAVMIEPFRDGVAQLPAYAISLQGRINKTAERSEIVYLMDADGAASIVTEIVALANRMGPEHAADFRAAFDARMDRLIAEGANGGAA